MLLWAVGAFTILQRKKRFELKKVITIILSAILLVCLVSCGKTEVAIEDYQWELTLIQSSKDGTIAKDGTVTYY